MERYRIHGSELAVTSRGSGLPLLLVHGFPFDHAMWSAQIESLAERCRIIAPDLRGFGRSDASEGMVTMDQFADDLDALLEAMGVCERVVYCGLSMGGYVGWSFFRRHRRRLRAMILCDTKAAADVPAAARMRLVNAERALSEGVDFLAESMVEKLFSPTSVHGASDIVARARRQMQSASPSAVAAALRGMAQRGDATELLEEIDLPVLAICGRDDVITPLAEMRAMAERIPGAALVEIPGAGHMAPWENPAAVNAAIASFLDQLR